MELLAAGRGELLSSIVAYVVVSGLLFAIARKMGAENAWWAWLPILDFLLMLDLAGMSWLWIFAMCVPLLNIIVLVVAWMKICEARRKPSVLGILMIVPIANLGVMLYLAVSE